MTASDALPVRLFREILIWPLALAGTRRDAPATVDALDKTLQAGLWTRVTDPRRHLDDDGDGAPLSREAYAEVVYFHPFVRSLLFPAADPAGDRPPVRLYRRADIKQVRLRGTDGRGYRLAVDRPISMPSTPASRCWRWRCPAHADGRSRQTTARRSRP